MMGLSLREIWPWAHHAFTHQTLEDRICADGMDPLKDGSAPLPRLPSLEDWDGHTRYGRDSDGTRASGVPVPFAKCA